MGGRADGGTNGRERGRWGAPRELMQHLSLGRGKKEQKIRGGNYVRHKLGFHTLFPDHPDGARGRG